MTQMVPVVQNPDGSYSSELTVTVESEALNNGKPTLIPTIISGKKYTVYEIS